MILVLCIHAQMITFPTARPKQFARITEVYNLTVLLDPCLDS